MAFRMTRAVMATAYLKKTTGIVGLAVEPKAREVLIGLYSQILDALKVRAGEDRWERAASRCGWAIFRARAQVLPADVEFRKMMTNVTTYRLKTVQQNESVSPWAVDPDRGGAAPARARHPRRSKTLRTSTTGCRWSR